ncbi:MAG: tetratricopeptide repeat protein [Candidatus Ozemobacteraceae bacterium]
MFLRNSLRWCLLLAMILCTGVLFASPQLQEAKAVCDQGDYARALDMFVRVQQMDPEPLAVKEARYFIGFCKVRLQDYWGAIAALEAFLGQYERTQMGDNFALIPDALYVLGRTYEQVNNIPQAVNVYQRCMGQFPGSNFAMQSGDRLRILGPVGPGPVGPGPGPIGPNPGDDRLIDDIIRMAKAAPTYAQQDEILLSGLNRARTGLHVLRLAQAASSNVTTDEICVRGVSRCFNVNEIVALAKATGTYAKQDEVCLLGADRIMIAGEFVVLANAAASNNGKDQVLGKGVARCVCVDDVIRLAKATGTYAKQDEICLMGVRLVRTFDEATRLSGATASMGAQQRVLDEARKILLGSPNYIANPSAMNVAGRGFNPGDETPMAKKAPKPATTPKGDKPLAKKVSVNPFENHKIDKDLVTRVNGYISAVATMKNVDQRRKALKPADLSLDAVKEAMKTFNQKSNFDKVHGK